MTDLTDEALDKLVARLQDDGLGFGIGPALLSQSAAAVINALRQREVQSVARAVAAVIEEAADRMDAGFSYNAGNRVRALHTDATRAALDKVRAEGMREAAARVTELEIANASLQYALNHLGINGSKGLME